jgi:hypothetical protein
MILWGLLLSMPAIAFAGGIVSHRSSSRLRHALIAFIDQNDAGTWVLRSVPIPSVIACPDTTTSVLVASNASSPSLVQAWPSKNLYLAYVEHQVDGAYHAYVKVKRSTNQGATWAAFATISQESSIADEVSCTWDNNYLYLIWRDCRSGEWKIYADSVAAP